MDLDQQIQDLIANAPQDDFTPQAVQAIAPVLKRVAGDLRHRQYYILQNFEEQWIVTSVKHRTQADLTRNVVYAFPTLKDAASGTGEVGRNPNLIALPIPVIQILFQLFAVEGVDSIIFFETPGQRGIGTEVSREVLQDEVHAFLQKKISQSIPPDIA